MGSILEATCSCGFHQKAALGGGINSHERLCSFPVICPKCHYSDIMNLFEPLPDCTQCGEAQLMPYDDPSITPENVGEVVFSWNTVEKLGRELCLTDQAYHCPVCRKRELYFRHGGYWD